MFQVQYSKPSNEMLLKASTNGHYFEDQNGDGVFWCGPGDPENFLHRGVRQADGTRSGVGADQDTILTNMVNNGGNCLYVISITSSDAEFTGHYPGVGDGPADGAPFITHNDITSGIDDDILTQWRGWFETARQNNIYILLFLFDDDVGVHTTDAAEEWYATTGPTETNELVFFNALIDKFGDLPNIVWCIAEEWTEEFGDGANGTDSPDGPNRIGGRAQYIKDRQTLAQLVSSHQRIGTSFHHSSDSRLDVFAMQIDQTTASALHTDCVTAVNNASGNYLVLMSEVPFGQMTDGTDADFRQQCWAMMMGGVCGVMVNVDGGTMTNSELAICGQLTTWLHAQPFTTLEPGDARAQNDTDYVLEDTTNHRYLCYGLDGTQISTIGINLPAGGNGTYDARWLGITGENETTTTPTLAVGSNAISVPAGLGTETEVAVFLEKQ